jgi:hypothetical protein
MVEVWVARARMGFVRVPWIQFGPLVGVRIWLFQALDNLKAFIFFDNERLEGCAHISTS